MPSLCSRALIIRRKCLLACERGSPDPCPGSGQGHPKETWEEGASLSFASQRCGEAAPLNGQLEALENGPVLAEILLSLTLFPGRASGCSQRCMSVSAVVPTRSGVCSSLHITLVLGMVPTVFGCCCGSAAHQPGKVLWALLPVITRPWGWRQLPFSRCLSQVWEVPVALGLAGDFFYHKACLVLRKSRLLMFICSWKSFWRQ